MAEKSSNVIERTDGQTGKAKTEEVDYAMVRDMGEGFKRGRVEITALGTTLNMVYGEWLPMRQVGQDFPVVVCIHGTPATEGAFRPIGSLIAAKGFRVLAVNFPGMGYTETDSSGCYDYSIGHKAELVKAFVFALKLQRVDMVIGHSTGSQVAARVAADTRMEGIVQSACFLCGTGIRSYSAQESATMIPYMPYLLYKAIYIPVIGSVLLYVMSRIVRRFGFRGRTPESQVLSIYEASKLRFDLYAKDLERLAERNHPVLVLYAEDDSIIEVTSSVEVVTTLQIPEQNCKRFDADDQSGYNFSDEDLRRAVCFAKGNHRLQFKKPDKTVQEIVSLLQALSSRS